MYFNQYILSVSFQWQQTLRHHYESSGKNNILIMIEWFVSINSIIQTVNNFISIQMHYLLIMYIVINEIEIYSIEKLVSIVLNKNRAIFHLITGNIHVENYSSCG